MRPILHCSNLSASRLRKIGTFGDIRSVDNFAEDPSLLKKSFCLKTQFYQFNGSGADIDAYPAALEPLSGDACGSTATERIEHHVTGVRACSNEAFKQSERFLCRISYSLLTCSG